jgi:hypothetical protein
MVRKGNPERARGLVRGLSAPKRVLPPRARARSNWIDEAVSQRAFALTEQSVNRAPGAAADRAIEPFCSVFCVNPVRFMTPRAWRTAAPARRRIRRGAVETSVDHACE